MIRPFCKYTKRNPFSPAFYLKNFELIPILSICILDVCMMVFWPIRTLFNTDCILTRNTRTPGEMTELLIHPRDRKLLHITQVLEPNQELYDLYEAMKECEEEEKMEREQQQKQQQNKT
ncbi:uncharacterized protein [Tenebrio molitor]|uniref:uncharacterized protein n=1 Tax=Tenebrio molitor TaxID=7067 RepID=UPI001C39F7AA|nr:unnamed protein product [Tenebrio molitor]